MDHTPGPWEFSAQTCYGKSPDPTEFRANGEPIPPPRPVVFSVTSHPVKDADRTLIAAAPDLLEACKAALDASEDPEWTPHQALPDDVEGLLRVAIAKAKT